MRRRYGALSHDLLGRAQRAGAPTKRKATAWEISDLKFQIEETAKANVEAVGHVFVRVTRAGAASRRPYDGKHRN
jgi:hypothetical protein